MNSSVPQHSLDHAPCSTEKTATKPNQTKHTKGAQENSWDALSPSGQVGASEIFGLF